MFSRNHHVDRFHYQSFFAASARRWPNIESTISNYSNELLIRQIPLWPFCIGTIWILRNSKQKAQDSLVAENSKNSRHNCIHKKESILGRNKHNNLLEVITCPQRSREEYSNDLGLQLHRYKIVYHRTTKDIFNTNLNPPYGLLFRLNMGGFCHLFSRR